MSARIPSEHEAKFSVAPESHPMLFSGEAVSFDGYTSRQIGAVSHIDTYFDTPSYDLLRHGFALRVRRKGADIEIGIKGIQATRKGAIQSRAEFTIALPPDADPWDATTWPDALLEQIQQSGGKARNLHPIVEIHQQRQKIHLHPLASENALAEWSLDEVWVAPIHKDTTDHASTAPDQEQMLAPSNLARSYFHELEIEQLGLNGADTSTAESDFVRLVTQAQSLFALQPVYTSKLIRGLEIAVTQAHGNASKLTPTMELADGVRLLLHQQLLQIILNEHGVRYSKKARYVHDMRVAIRRARTVIAMSEKVLPQEMLAPIDKSLRRLGRYLGALRDLDVALSNLRAFRQQQHETHHKAIKSLRREIKRQRAATHADLVDYLDSKRHRKFIAEFAAFCATPLAEKQQTGKTGKVLPCQVRHTIPSLILTVFESVRAYETVFEDGALPSLETFHELRIRAKNLRYVLEFTEHLLGKDIGPILTLLRDLQDHLGQLNDAYVEQQRLQQWAARTRDTKIQGSDSLSAAIETRLALLAPHIDELAAATPERLTNFVRSANRLRLARAIARL